MRGPRRDRARARSGPRRATGSRTPARRARSRARPVPPAWRMRPRRPPRCVSLPSPPPPRPRLGSVPRARPILPARVLDVDRRLRQYRRHGAGAIRGDEARATVIVHLVDGTFELFRHFLSPAAAFDRSAPEELRAVRGVVASVLGMLEGGATHLGVATDHVVESFRNALWPGYKTGEGIDPVLFAQFTPLEEEIDAIGVIDWPMVEIEADDALAAAAEAAAADPRVEQVIVCTPDKDLAQCVRGERVVQFDRRTREMRDEAGVRRKFGVAPASIP